MHARTRAAQPSGNGRREAAGVVGGRAYLRATPLPLLLRQAPLPAPRARLSHAAVETARPPPRVRVAFFYSDHRPRPTRRAVRTSSYITRGARGRHTSDDNRVRCAPSSVPSAREEARSSSWPSSANRRPTTNIATHSGIRKNRIDPRKHPLCRGGKSRPTARPSPLAPGTHFPPNFMMEPRLLLFLFPVPSLRLE